MLDNLPEEKSTFLNQQQVLTKSYCYIALFHKVSTTTFYIHVVPLKSLPVTLL